MAEKKGSESGLIKFKTSGSYNSQELHFCLGGQCTLAKTFEESFFEFTGSIFLIRGLAHFLGRSSSLPLSLVDCIL